MNWLTGIDQQWAWQTYRPSDEVKWDESTAAHLFRRAGFGVDLPTLKNASKRDPQDVVDELVSNNQEPNEFSRIADSLARTVLAGGDPMKLSSAWVYRLLFTPSQLLEKLTLFWHGHFATGAEKVADAAMMWNQNRLLRRHAMGDFRALTQGIAKDPAMLIYLDSASNRKAHPNENFARELMELFCLGEGNYSETDVLELARCFTGWEIRNDRFRKNRYQQDRGRKSVLEQSGAFDGEEAIDIVLQRDEMPLFICRKLFRYFICDEPSPPDELLAEPARVFRESGLQIAPLARFMLSSNLFFSHYSRARKIKSPVELIVGCLRGLEGTTSSGEVAQGLRSIGQGLFYPPNVKGWDGGRTWINSSTLLGRSNLFEKILSSSETKFGGVSMAEYLGKFDITTADDALKYFETCFMAISIDKTSRRQLLAPFESSAELDDQSVRQLFHRVASLPEFQLA
ncbi:MAG: DUF1800 domain-containing protein [Planctomycetota bacterium]